MYDGGSTVFWYELLRPQNHVALDIQDKTDTPYFHRDVKSLKLGERIKTYWNTTKQTPLASEQWLRQNSMPS
jgi:hypothetical protein